MQLVGFTGPQKRRHDVKHLLSNQALLQLCDRLTPRETYSIAEKLSGDIIKHSFYAARSADRSARLEDDPTLYILLTGEMKDMHERIHQAIVPGETLSITYTVGSAQEVFKLPGNAINKRVFKYFDGVTPIQKMISKVKIASGGGNPLAIKAEIENAFELLHSMGWAYLRSGSAAKAQ